MMLAAINIHSCFFLLFALVACGFAIARKAASGCLESGHH